jgi:hypothetical protein
VRERRCYICGAHVAPGQALHSLELRILSCLGDCTEILKRTSRDYSRSEGGRKLPPDEVLRRLEAVRR